MGRGLHVAVVGATGAVGQQMLKTLADRDFEMDTLTLLSSKRSAGTKVTFRGQEYTVQEATPESFEGVNIALFSAGGNVSKALAPEAVKRGAIVVDNTSAFRMDENTPLVVPEVNEKDLHDHQGIIANPNCSTIQMVAALEPLRQAYGMKKVIVSTYQAVSGAGHEAIDELYSQSQAILNKEDVKPEVMPYQIAFNAIPQIDKFQDNGYTFEEMKMINETKKIMHLPELEVAATCVRLPIETGHSESVYVELKSNDATVDDIKSILKDAPGITLQDDPSQQIYPMPADAVGKNDVFVGRIRKDLDRPNGFHMWIVSDNLLKGAAWNSVQIAESLRALKLV
ncbi:MULTISPECIES: aspartate-semialdehyde dehydrogenase [Bacillus]|uniref:aspartate-semialdehyde dehydrogenase n=1 Tax=Bacillus TaxID=1386 RepID=UPI000260BF89|nr:MULTISPECIES: aspartate-semialdehyde dehydrogenase [Bacillus]AHL71470.1 aspartate-semialdehyde dehydrogenase [Bacillus pumilus]KML17852.1 aspartate-semialdehyde dehydrogenase [Bacillus stratosphericus]EIL84704.1 aspartate-semialdehyde dehydrogenase [Bacillus sp. M 2-6]KKK11187.1 aspartate-semialdehyde dehydrogenase [Bacillus sp. L_1B0_12]KML64074.1 aspartate-semialdehyde dehydrogenase [Bacillus stratosphericus]